MDTPKKPNYRERTRMRTRLMHAGNTHCPECGGWLDWGLGWYVDPKDGRRKRHPYSVEYDHETANADGGDNSWANAQAMHRICNQRKSGGKPARARSKQQTPPEPLEWSSTW